MNLPDIIEQRKVIVCCGAGGVGKTTVSASIAVSAAKAGKRVLIMTIDPSKRLAQVLGVGSKQEKPVNLTADKLEQLDITTGNLSAWMLDPMIVSRNAVNDAITNKRDLKEFLSNPLFQQLSVMTSGLQEYSAMKALHSFEKSGEYDTIVVDTPPSRHALDFLYAPERLAALFDAKIMMLFRASEQKMFRKAAAAVVDRTMRSLTGEGFAEQLFFFLSQFEKVFKCFEQDATQTRKMLETDKAAFVLVTSPAEQAVDEAFLFQDQARKLRLPVGGFVLNRSSAHLAQAPMPKRSDYGSLAEEMWNELERQAACELKRASDDYEVLRKIRSRAASEAFVVDLPLLAKVSDELAGLSSVSQELMRKATAE